MAMQDHGVLDAEQLLSKHGHGTGALKEVERATRIMVRSGWQKWLTVMRVEMPRAAMVCPTAFKTTKGPGNALGATKPRTCVKFVLHESTAT